MEQPTLEYTDVMEDMDADLLNLLKRQLDSFIKWDLVKFFYRQPDNTYQAQDLVQHLNRDLDELETAAQELASAGILDRRWRGNQAGFALAADPTTRRLVAKFMQACQDRYFRMKVVYHILRGLSHNGR
ncbi:MAG: hypothetical protein KKA73_30760 [Chloroflexi bacterium]|nr:hypothetical protein [Chloroflexota bacterium]MBU1752083.1 hypothetical protein [Chloroflexota bacterium]MBU1877635.1 hypothetical protein [Chloroflexota bacterium]